MLERPKGRPGDAEPPPRQTVERIAGMLGVEQTPQLGAIIQKLPKNTTAILDHDLQRTGIDDGYIPAIPAAALFSRIHSYYENAEDPEAFSKSTELALTTTARIFQEVRIAIKKKAGHGHYPVNINDLLDKAAENPDALATHSIKLSSEGDGTTAILKEKPEIDLGRFEKIESLAQISGEKIVLVGIGGGSDAVQAAMLGKLLARSGKKIEYIASIRTARTGSQTTTGEMGQQRKITNPGAEIVPNVITMTSDTRGDGDRFFENLFVDQFPSCIILDERDEDLTAKVQAVVDAVGADTVIAVDTGGDGLYSEADQDFAKATPGQDLRSLDAINRVNVTNKLSCEIAVGIDSPPNAQDILATADAKFYELSPDENAAVQAQYVDWEIDGKPTNHKYGKTAFAWQAALRGETNYYCVPLPLRIVLDDKHPWDPYVSLIEASKGLFFMNLEKHLAATAPNLLR